MKRIAQIYRKLLAAFGPQGWWPAETPFEVMVGAILTQNTNWRNVEKALSALKDRRLLSPRSLLSLKANKLAALIRPAGYYNIKAKRLKNFLEYFQDNYSSSLRRLSRRNTAALRQELLAINGIGPETADSILLYALDRPVFVVDSYTKRILYRHGLIRQEANYQEVQDLFTRNLKKNTRLFNEYHALIVRLAKRHCRSRLPDCSNCPLKDIKKER